MNLKTAELAHDLKMPIQLIYSCVQLLEMEVAPDSSAQSYLDLLMQSARQLQQMVLNALDGEQLKSGHSQIRRARQDVVAIAHDLYLQSQPCAREKGIRLEFYTNAAEFAMQTDGEKLNRILLNLLSNAFRFTPAGGSVQLSVQVCGDAVEISVRDTGCGMSPEQLGRIFRRGETEGGHGYGLYIVREYTKLLGGSVHVDSAPGEGSVFTCYLPVRAAGSVRSAVCKTAAG